ncbi:MAG: pyruvate dehydrogenase (acetyl-transferring), homodimeric type [Candidatus Hydrogenedentes bacterium]|nr:pyruvate dehydrogenase (acetyl-transferring), homodimeric type [Candidatus Hydrogenedentota bacterium]
MSGTGHEDKTSNVSDLETADWLDSLDDVIKREGPARAARLLERLQAHAQEAGLRLPFSANTPYVNTIPADEQPVYPGDRALERRIKSIIRWNAMAMVVRANRDEHGIGGHISTYASAATLYEVAFNHFFRAPGPDRAGDQVYFQGHAAPGIYSRAFLEGRLSIEQLRNFRRELRPGGGLSSYPHPWLMPEFWQFPTVSMGLGPIMSIYQARFNRYLEDRGLKKDHGTHVWAFLGDGECDEPETLGAITLAARERLDNLIFVINCNLQRLDGPVRGNQKIIQELEAIFRGAGWNVIKVIWGSDWDPLLEQDTDGLLVKRMGEVVDGEYQKYTVESGQYIRDHFFGVDARLRQMVDGLSDQQLRRLNRGGHDPAKVYAAYHAATRHKGQPTVILAKTVKGYGLGEAGEGRNITHQQKKLNEDELSGFRTRFGIPISDEAVALAPLYRPADDSPEMAYLRERRAALGGHIPARSRECAPLKAPSADLFAEFIAGTGERQVSTTMAIVGILTKLLRDDALGKWIVPIVPDEARTFGMEALFRQVGIYAHSGQLYEPVDSDSLIYYKEAQDGQILEEGITEAGSMASFVAAGTAYATHGVPMLPFFIFYSMFGFQRIGDLVWAAADMRCRGFLVGGTAGRTTLAGEGLQHQDGHSHLLASTVPTLITYDPAFAFELAVIVREGIRRMYEAQENVFYYLTVGNENYAMPAMPEGGEEGILKGLYRFRPARGGEPGLKVHLLGSGAIMNEALKAQELLAREFGVAADVWSATSYTQLRREALEVERWNMLHPDQEPRRPYVSCLLDDAPGAIVAASDYMKALPDSIGRWVPQLVSLGTDGFGRSESRAALRDFFGVDARHIALAALYGLARDGRMAAERVRNALSKLDIDPDKPNPMTT